MVKYSFVVPAYNEEAVLNLFYQRVTSVFAALDGEYEIIIVNDGSTDKTAEIIKDLCKEDYRVKGVSFSRNFGQENAILAGFSYARGQAVVCMDADLQDPPEVAVQMIREWKKGYEIVHAKYRKREGETVLKKATSRLYYRMINRLIDLDMPVDCSYLKLFDRKAVDVLIHLKERVRFLRAQTAWIGFKQGYVEFDRPARAAGKTKYDLKKLVKLAKASLLPHSYSLHRASAMFGGLFVAGSCFVYILFGILTGLGVEFGGLTAWLFPTVALAVGILLLNSGLQNAYLYEIYKEEQNRPPFIVSERYNLSEKE